MFQGFCVLFEASSTRDGSPRASLAWSTIGRINTAPGLSKILPRLTNEASVRAARAGSGRRHTSQIRDLSGMYPMGPEWSNPAIVDQHPLILMPEVNGLIIDVR